MDVPVAVSLQGGSSEATHRVAIDPAAAARLVGRSGETAPAVVVATHFHRVDSANAGILNPADVLAVVEGDWSRAIIVIVQAGPEASAAGEGPLRGDVAFLAEAKAKAPELVDLASYTLSQIRSRGVTGQLSQEGGGRWVNRPNNCFTMKVQPRARNLHFTLYGNPETFDAGAFLQKDQNSYSRGWVKDRSDAEKLAQLAASSQARRTR